MKHLHSRTPSLIEPLEARIAPIADLLLKITSIEFPNVAVPGDTGTITMTIENIGDDPATNTTDINIWLVPDPGAGQKPGDSVYNNGNFGWNTAKSMKIVEGDKDVPLNLKPVSEGGGTKIVKKKFTLPDLILGEGTVAPGDLYSTGDPGGPSVFHPFNMTPGLHYIVAEVDGGNENEPIFFSHRNNFAAPAGPFDYQYQFGTVGSRSEVLLHTTSGIFDTTTRTFPGPSADFSLSGGGTGRIDVVNSSADDNLVFTNTSASSFAAALGFKSKSGDDVLVLNNITASGPMKGIKLPNFELTGSVDVSGALGGLELRGIGGSGTHINIGGAASDPPAKIILGRVTNLDLTSGVGLAVLQVIDWNKGGASDTITAPFISDLSTKGDAKAGIAGDFAADLSLNGADAKGRVLGEASFEGKIANATWTATGNGNAGDITADGANQWTLNVAGNVGEVFIAGDLILNKAAPSLTAKSFKEITALGTLGAYIKTTGADSKGVAIGTVKAHSIDGSTIDASTGVIKSVTSGDWINGGNLKAAKIDKLTTTGKNVTTPGDFSASVAVITLAGGFGDLEKATIAGALKTGTWNVANFLEALTAGQIAADWTLSGAHRVIALTVKGAVAGKLTARDFDKVHFGDFTGSINATGIGNAGIESFTAGNVTGATLSAAGRVSQVSVQQWSGGSLTADTFGALSFTGKGGGTGDLKNTTVKVTGAGLNSGITKITAKGSLASLIIDAGPAYIGSIKADEWVSGSLTAQGLAGLDLDGDKARSVRGDLSGVTIRLFDPNTTLAKAEIAGFIIGSAVAGAPPTIQTDGKIGLLQCLGMENATIKVQGGLGLNKLWIKGTETGKNFFIASNVTATQIGTVILNNVKTSNGGTAFGITAAAIAKYLRKTNGIVDEAETGLNPSKSPFDVDVDYRVLLKANPFT